jgi:molybdopterin molybdotransferase
MISVREAEKIILDQARGVPTQTLALEKAYGLVLREDIAADRDQPAFDKSTMDGIALSFNAWQQDKRSFNLEGIAPAGQAQLKLKNSNGCVQIMTGAVVPQGCDCVVPIEQCRIENKVVTVAASKIEPRQFIRHRGADHKKYDVLLKKGARLLPPQIATAASFGRSRIKVSVKPKIAVIATGDELVDIDKKNIKPYQVRKSNSYALDAALMRTGLCDPTMFHFIDDKKILRNGIRKILSKFDILLLSGGVSMGEFDFVPQVLDELDVKVLFHKVSQKPGKPFWFGRDKNGKAVFALPGNPVSTQICAYRYVIPYLHKAVGLPYNVPSAVLAEDLSVTTDLTYFAPVKIFSEHNGTLCALPVTVGGSGDYAALSLADGFLELAAGRRHFPKGSSAPFYTW